MDTVLYFQKKESLIIITSHPFPYPLQPVRKPKQLSFLKWKTASNARPISASTLFAPNFMSSLFFTY
jgi:hypothetical protein